MCRAFAWPVAALLVAATLAGAAEKAKKDADPLEGTWKATAINDHGQKAPDVEKLKMTVTFAKGKYTLKIGDKVAEEGTYKIDSGKDPKQLDTTATSGPTKGKLDPGIYSLKGDTLKTAFAGPEGKERPTSFDGEKYQVMEFTKVKP